MDIWALPVLHLTLLLRGVWGSAGPLDLASVVHNLTQFSSPWIRPVRAWDRALNVHLDLQVISILDVRWRDEFVSWDPSSYGGLSHFTLPSSRLWSPEISVREAISEERQHLDPYVSVSSLGWVSRVELLLLTLRCDLALFLFPFDKQSCNITLGSNLHTVQDVALVLEEPGFSVLNGSVYLRPHGEWDLMAVQLFSFTQTERGQEHSHLTFQVELERYSLFYVVNLMVPSGLVMLIDLASFAIPVESAERIPFKVTLLFGYTVFLVLVTDLLPPFRDNTPMLGVYLVGCLVFLSVSMGESVLLLALGLPGSLPQQSPLHRLALKLSPHLLQTGGAAQQHAAHNRSVNRGLRRSYGLRRCGAGLATCGRGCVIGALGEELEEISEELASLNRRSAEHRDTLLLMEALDSLCFRLHASLLAMFMLSLVLLWTMNR